MSIWTSFKKWAVSATCAILLCFFFISFSFTRTCLFASYRIAYTIRMRKSKSNRWEAFWCHSFFFFPSSSSSSSSVFFGDVFFLLLFYRCALNSKNVFIILDVVKYAISSHMQPHFFLSLSYHCLNQSFVQFVSFSLCVCMCHLFRIFTIIQYNRYLFNISTQYTQTVLYTH